MGSPWPYVRALWLRIARRPAPSGWPVGAASALWRALRAATGDDAYERYLAHHRLHHGGDGVPMSRAGFFRAEQRRKWDGVRRCC
ncbi:MAG: hypothetical protein NFCOHLIN_02467 [Gammaproteobacteria bacterium]|nr:hypothetical protein [Gammaproteobacteria bacterium]